MTATASIMKLRACGRLLALALGVAVLGAPARAAADPVKADVKVFNDSGYARLVFRLDEPVDAKVTCQRRDHGDHLQETDGYRRRPSQCRRTGLHQRRAARSRRHCDPHRALARRSASTRSLPANGSMSICCPRPGRASAPGLPQEVIDELARRARDAERSYSQQRLSRRQQTPPTIRVKVAKQPTFMRYVFEMPIQVNAVPERERRRADADVRSADQMGSGRGQRHAAADAGVDRIRARFRFHHDQLHPQWHARGAAIPRGPQPSSSISASPAASRSRWRSRTPRSRWPRQRTSSSGGRGAGRKAVTEDRSAADRCRQTNAAPAAPAMKQAEAPQPAAAARRRSQ